MKFINVISVVGKYDQIQYKLMEMFYPKIELKAKAFKTIYIYKKDSTNSIIVPKKNMSVSFLEKN